MDQSDAGSAGISQRGATSARPDIVCYSKLETSGSNFHHAPFDTGDELATRGKASRLRRELPIVVTRYNDNLQSSIFDPSPCASCV
eukprot:6953731-Pyramimonas_sp.AAC.1